MKTKKASKRNAAARSSLARGSASSGEIFTQIQGYAVLLRRKDGHEWLACGENMNTPIYRRRAGARRFRDQLQGHVGKIGRVVKVEEIVRILS